MGFVFRIFCESCYYAVDDIVVGDAQHAIAACPSCGQIRNPEMPLFRCDPPRCVACGSALEVCEPEFCLRCNAPLRYKQGMHFVLNVPDRYPELGEVVHAYFDDQLWRWRVPRLWLNRGKVTICGIPDNAANRVIEARVTEIVKADEWVSSITLRFVGIASIEPPRPYRR